MRGFMIHTNTLREHNLLLLAFPGNPGNLFLNSDVNFTANGIKMVIHLMIVKPHNFQAKVFNGLGAFFIMGDVP